VVRNITYGIITGYNSSFKLVDISYEFQFLLFRIRNRANRLPKLLSRINLLVLIVSQWILWMKGAMAIRFGKLKEHRAAGTP
jgi:hypothetical protein